MSYLDYSKNSRSNVNFFEFVKSDYFDFFPNNCPKLFDWEIKINFLKIANWIQIHLK